MHVQGDAFVQFSQYLDIHGESKLDISTSLLKDSSISPRLVKWNISCRFLIGSDCWFLPTVLHQGLINNVHQHVGSWFHCQQWPTKGLFNIIAYLWWWYHALCSIWESLGPLHSGPFLCNDILHHLWQLHPLQFGKSDLGSCKKLYFDEFSISVFWYFLDVEPVNYQSMIPIWQTTMVRVMRWYACDVTSLLLNVWCLAVSWMVWIWPTFPFECMPLYIYPLFSEASQKMNCLTVNLMMQHNLVGMAAKLVLFIIAIELDLLVLSIYGVVSFHLLHLLRMTLFSGAVLLGSSEGSLAADASFKMKQKILMIWQAQTGGFISVHYLTLVSISLPLSIEKLVNPHQCY